MMLSNKQIYQYHTWLGLIGGFFILLLSLTGCILIFENEIDSALNSALVNVNPQGTHKNLDDILVNVLREYPQDQLLNLRIYANQSDRAIRAEILQNQQVKWVYINPYTAQILGEKNKNEAFIRVVFGLHEKLLMGFAGHLILGLMGFCLLGSVVTGFIYYRKSIFAVFKTGVRFGKHAQIVNADLHKLLGVSALLFMFVISVTGIFFHIEKVEGEVEQVFNTNKGQERKESAIKTKPDFSAISLTKFEQIAQNKCIGFKVEFIRLPEYAGDKLSMRGNRTESIKLLGKYGTTLDMDTKTGEVIKIFHAEQANQEYMLEHIIEELHFGRYGGGLTKTIYFFGGLATMTMTITGFFVWWRNKKYKSANH
jgi:uncharacterized iron-regulated membrane protein